MEKNNSRSLYQLKPGQSAQVKEIQTDAHMADKLAAMGIVRGQFVKRQPGNSPVVVSVSGTDVAIGRETAKKIIVTSKKNTFLLAGNPNVGKSLIFSRLTGVGVISSNFPGTTVGLNYGTTQFNGESYDIIDIPGLYRLEEEWQMEGKKHHLFKELEYDFIVCVADASHLERNLYFLLELLSLNKPAVLMLNKFDEAKRKGIFIDVKKLSKLLGLPVIPTVATTGEGLKELANTVGELDANTPQISIPKTDEEKWQTIGKIIGQVQEVKHKHPSFWEHLQAWATTPLTGLPIALLVLIISFFVVRFVGESIINFVDPLYENYYFPFMEKLLGAWRDNWLGMLLVGDGGEAYFGVLTDGLKIALVDVMSYVLAFYALFGFLGDIGYLPRLAILLDGILHKIGLHGYGAIPIMLGFGCKVPAVMGARVLETRRERVIALALVLVLAPCISQTAMIISILSPHGLKYMLLVFGVLVINGILAGSILNRLLKGEAPELFMEIPSWQIPSFRALGRKLWLRMKEYLCDALPLILCGVLFVDLMQMSGVTDLITKISRYPVEYILGLPADTTSLLILGFLRKDVAIALLEPFNLSAQMLVVACVFMTMYLPCIATFFVMLRENGWKDTLRVVGLTLGLALLTGFILRLILL
ncbi:FeoB small GTPase domain-containing protein [Candidatus Avelusimicrobium caledoniensis]|uniref:FeoB small GTPase domain-containing protein n=1 Tax=Candidatus Avelusimicrobium caledoniensis TaxID=3416220 RepID=UPI003D13CF77